MDNQPSTPKRPLFRGSPIFGLVVILIGFLILYFFGQTSQLLCSRQVDKTVNCSLKISVMGLIPIHSAEVPGVQSAQVGQRDCSGTNCYYRVELVQANGLTPFTSNYSGGRSDKQTLADQVNRTLQDSSQQNFSIGTPLNPIIPLCALLFAAMGVYFIFVPTRSGGHHYH